MVHDFFIPKTPRLMVINQSNCLHEGKADGGADEAEAAGFEIGAHYFAYFNGLFSLSV